MGREKPAPELERLAHMVRRSCSHQGACSLHQRDDQEPLVAWVRAGDASRISSDLKCKSCTSLCTACLPKMIGICPLARLSSAPLECVLLLLGSQLSLLAELSGFVAVTG